jgi:DNA polymerase-3 subunit delta
MPPRFYLLHGPDEFASREFLDGLKAKMGDPAVAALSTTVFDGRSASLGEVRAICDTLPFMTPRRLVIVEGWLTRLAGRADEAEAAAEAEAGGEAATEERRGRGSGAAAKETLAELAAYLPNLPESTALVLVEPREIPARNPVLKAATGADWAFVRRFDLPKGDALVRWIRARAKAEGGEFTREAAEALAEVEADPRGLDQEISKLLTYVDLARPVALDDVQALTPAGGEAVIFDLVDAIGQRRGPAALRELRRMLERAEPLYVFAMIVRQYRLLLQARELQQAGAGEAEIAQALNMKAYPAGKLAAQARNFSLDDLERIYRELLEVDVAIKTGQMDTLTALDTLVGALTAA